MKTRVKMQMFADKKDGKTVAVSTYFCVQVWQPSTKWRNCGDENGLFKFKSEEQANIKADELSKLEVSP